MTHAHKPRSTRALVCDLLLCADKTGKGCNSNDVLKKASQVWLMDGEEFWLKEALEKHPNLQVKPSPPPSPHPSTCAVADKYERHLQLSMLY